MWTYSLAVYNRPGVQPLLLQLQDDFGADINLLLGCCWLAADAKALTADDLSALIRASEQWRAQCIIPLRAVRRFLKSRPQVESLYQRAKTLEVDAEQWQQDQRSAGNLPASELCTDELALHNLRQYCERLPGVEWQAVAGLISELVALTGLKSRPGC